MTVSDIIRRSDAMGAVQDHFNADGFKGYDDGQKMMDRIKALPSAETHDKRTETHSVCSDVISRQDAIEAIEEITWYHQNRNREMVSGANSTEDQAWYKSQDIYAALEALPSVEAIHKPDYSYEAGMVRRLKEALSAEARPTGEWVKREKIGLDENDTESLLYYWYECSECGHKPPCDSFRNEWHSSYCPSCGAKMRGEENEIN